jgi:hypothetical protein
MSNEETEDLTLEEMREASRKKNGRRRTEGKMIALGTYATIDEMGTYVDERCKCCMHEHRKAIDQLLVTPNISGREISRLFGVSKDSVYNHGRNHLNYNAASIKRVIEEEAAAMQENVEDGVKGVLARRVFLSSYIQRTMEALLSNELPLSGKEAMAAIQMLTTYEESETAMQMQMLQDQFNAFQQAMKELVPPEMWYAIVDRTKEIADAQNFTGRLRETLAERRGHNELPNPDR